MLLEDSSEVLMSPVQFTEITVRPDPNESQDEKKPFRLQDLFLNFDSFPEEVR